MHLLYEILPLFLFFIAFKWFDIYVATIIGIVSTLLQVMITRIRSGKWDRKQLITLGVFVFFGGMTLYFHNPIFVKWKPTIVFWIFSLVILGSHFTLKPLMQRLMENVLEDKDQTAVPKKAWKVLNLIWSGFFFSLGTLNLYIAYHLSNDAWVNFKFYGITVALILFSIFQGFYLMQFITPEKSNR